LVINAATMEIVTTAMAAIHLVTGAPNHRPIVKALATATSVGMDRRQAHLQLPRVHPQVQLQAAKAKQLWNAMEH